jgi:phosphate-selective porin OprO/OprP
LYLLCLLAGNSASGMETTDPDPKTAGEQAVSEALADMPYINSLLIDREFPLLGGRWGSEIFVDAPLNGEPEGAQITLRRAKLQYARTITAHWRLKLAADYTRGGGLELSDNFISYNGWKHALLTLGISDPPYSLESDSQSSALTFMERGLPVVALSERKSGGATLLRRSMKSILNASLILFNVSRDDLREEGQGIVLHYVHSPIRIGAAKSVHLGGSFSYRFNSNEDSTQFRSRPEVATVNDYYVDTGFIANADRVSRLSVEASQVAGRFSWQSEVLAARVQRDGAETVSFWGAYAYLSWFLTGDSRHYNFGSGRFERVRVRSPLLEGGAGAFELALRASFVDLSDRDVVGGRQSNLSIGLNWYLNRRIRLMSNLIKVLDVNRPGSEYDGLDPLILSLRAQWVLD